MMMWALYEGSTVHAIAVTEIGVYPAYRVMRVVLLAGSKMKDWAHLEGLFEAHARSHDCAFIEGLSRPGMSKITQQLGYKTVYHVIRKPVYKQVH